MAQKIGTKRTVRDIFQSRAKKAACRKREGNSVNWYGGGDERVEAAKAQSVLVDQCIYTWCNGNYCHRKRKRLDLGQPGSLRGCQSGRLGM